MLCGEHSHHTDPTELRCSLLPPAFGGFAVDEFGTCKNVLRRLYHIARKSAVPPHFRWKWSHGRLGRPIRSDGNYAWKRKWIDHSGMGVIVICKWTEEDWEYFGMRTWLPEKDHLWISLWEIYWIHATPILLLSLYALSQTVRLLANPHFLAISRKTLLSNTFL